MNGIEATKDYVERIISGDGKCRGMKVLLLDAFTTQIVSCVYSQNEILSKEVYLVSRLDDASFNPNLKTDDHNNDLHHNNNNGMMTSIDSANALNQHDLDLQKTSHLKAIVYIRPTESNIGLLLKELSKPRFTEYHIFVSGILTSGLLRLLAENDTAEVIQQIQEFYGDYLPINDCLITINTRNSLSMTASAGTAWARDYAHLYERNRQGVESMLLSLKRQPHAIRYQASSPLAQQLARDVHESIVSDQIFHFRNSKCLLLILDRVDDPVTPLLSQWTYQAMVHELLGLNNNRVILKGAPNITEDLEEVVLSATQDDFFRRNMYANFGELGEAIQKLLQDYQRSSQKPNNDLNTIEEMQSFMEKFPELRSQSHNVSKHVAIMGELARLVDICSLMDVSQFEQELACSDDHSIHMRELLDKLASPTIKIPDKLRLGLLYALRYENIGNLHRIKAEMKKGGVPEEMVNLMDTMLGYAGSKQRGPGLYGMAPKDIMSKMTRSFMTGVQGVSNVYAQHVPVLMDTIHDIAKGKRKSDTHPYIIGGGGGGDGRRNSGGGGGSGNGVNEFVPQEIIVFMAGGITYEEATKVHEFNENNSGKIRVVLGGSTIHNSTSFLEELKALQ